MESETLGKVAFREAYKAASDDRQFRDKHWVIKRYADSQNYILPVEESAFQHAQKQVQAHKLARKIKEDLQNSVNDKASFLPTISFNEVYIAMLEGETIIIKEFADANFMKYINKDGTILNTGDSDNDVLKKTECCSHVSDIKSEGELIVLDIQGCDYTIFDPEVVSSLYFFEEGTLFGVGNLFEQAIETLLTLFLMGEAKSLFLPTSFCPVTSINVGTSPQTFLTFGLNFSSTVV